MAYADWTPYEYESFHDATFIEIFNNLDLAYLSDTEVERAEELFEAGWTNFNISEDERAQFREDFYNAINYRFGSEEWQTYREIYDATNG